MNELDQITNVEDLDRQTRLPSNRDVLSALSDCFGVDVDEIKEHTRRQSIVQVRQTIMYLLREYGDMSFPAIGRLLGNRDHTTVIHGYSKIKNYIANDPTLTESWKVPIEIASTIKERKARVELKLRELQQKIVLAAASAKSLPKSRPIPERNMRILEMYREGLTLQNIAIVVGITRERVRQIVLATIKQSAINESISQGIEMDLNVLIEEENRKRKDAREAKKPKKPSKKEKRWSTYYAACRNCGTTAIPHLRKGLCEKCAGNLRGERREKMIAEHSNHCDRCGISREQAIQKYNRDLYLTRNDGVLCKSCFRFVTGKKLGGYKRYDWSRYYERCKKCGSTSIPHAKNGFCKECAGYLTNDDKERIIQEHGGQCDRCGISKGTALAELGRNLYVTKLGETLCHTCFQRYRHELAVRGLRNSSAKKVLR